VPPPWAYTPLAIPPQFHPHRDDDGDDRNGSVGIVTYSIVALTSFISGFFFWTVVRIFRSSKK